MLQEARNCVRFITNLQLLYNTCCVIDQGFTYFIELPSIYRTYFFQDDPILNLLRNYNIYIYIYNAYKFNKL